MQWIDFNSDTDYELLNRLREMCSYPERPPLTDEEEEELVESLLGVTRGIKKEDFGLTPKETEIKKVINLKNAEKYFPKKYGVELEFESNEPIGRSWLFEKLDKDGLDVDSVLGDGSLSEYGFEILSKPQKDLESLLNFMTNTLDTLNKLDLDFTCESPCAVHIHVSNMRAPINLFLLGIFFEKVFDKIRNDNYSGLVHNFMFIPEKRELRNVLKSLNEENPYTNFNDGAFKSGIKSGFDPYITYILNNVYDLFMGQYRRTTIRYSGFDTSLRTMEFRVFPQTVNKNVYKTYIKIVGYLIFYAETHSLEEIFELFGSHYGSGRHSVNMHKLILKFKKICNLSDGEMYSLFHNFNQNEDIGGLKWWEIYNLVEPVTKLGNEDTSKYYFKNNITKEIYDGYCKRSYPEHVYEKFGDYIGTKSVAHGLCITDDCIYDGHGGYKRYLGFEDGHTMFWGDY